MNKSVSSFNAYKNKGKTREPCTRLWKSWPGGVSGLREEVQLAELEDGWEDWRECTGKRPWLSSFQIEEGLWRAEAGEATGFTLVQGLGVVLPAAARQWEAARLHIRMCLGLTWAQEKEWVEEWIRGQLRPRLYVASRKGTYNREGLADQ